MPTPVRNSIILVAAAASALQRPATHSLARRRGTPLLAAKEVRASGSWTLHWVCEFCSRLLWELWSRSTPWQWTPARTHFSMARPRRRRRRRRNAGGLQPALPRRVQDRVRDRDRFIETAPRDAVALLRRQRVRGSRKRRRRGRFWGHHRAAVVGRLPGALAAGLSRLRIGGPYPSLPLPRAHLLAQACS